MLIIQLENVPLVAIPLLSYIKILQLKLVFILAPLPHLYMQILMACNVLIDVRVVNLPMILKENVYQFVQKLLHILEIILLIDVFRSVLVRAIAISIIHIEDVWLTALLVNIPQQI